MPLSDISRQFLATLLENRTGQQLSTDRSWRIDTALASVMREEGIRELGELVARLSGRREPALAEKVVDALLNNETSFFRDRLPFELLVAGPLKRLEQARAPARRLSIWCAGCSTGQEPYSLAMLFAEDPRRWRDWRIEIVGTDVAGGAVEQARSGRYSQFEVQRGLPVRQMVRWFAEAGKGDWQIAEPLRRMVRFEQASLAGPAPHPGRFDIVLCRNVLLYFAPAMRRDAFARLAEACAPDGVLMLGAGETVIGQTDRFVSDPEHRGLYRPAQPQARVA